VSDGTVHVDAGAEGLGGIEAPVRIDALDAWLSVASGHDGLTIDIERLSMRTVDPSVTLEDLSGVVRRTQRGLGLEEVTIRTGESALRLGGTIAGLDDGALVLDVSASSDRLSLAELARFVPALRGYRLEPAFDISARGPLDALSLTLDLRERRAGEVTADLTVDALEPGRRVAGTAALVRVNVAPLLPPPESARASPAQPITSDISGSVSFDVALPDETQPVRGTYAIRTGRIAVAGYQAERIDASGRVDGTLVQVDAAAGAYGAQVTANGTVKAGEPLVVDLRGRTSGLDLRNLPASLGVPAAPSDLTAEYSIAGRGDVFSGDVRLEASTLAGAAIEEGTTATFRVGGGAPQFAAAGRVTGLDLQQVGRGFDIAALTEDRYRSRIDANVDVTGRGGGTIPLSIDAVATIVDSEVLGASVPRLDVAAQLSDGDLWVSAVGDINGLDPAAVSGDARAAGSVNATLDVRATLRQYAAGVTVDSIDASGRIWLEDSVVGDVEIATAVVDGRYSGREGRLTQLEITGPVLNATGEGTLSLSNTGASLLTLRLEAATLERLGSLIDEPLQGSAIVDAVLTGNARELVVKGMLDGTNVRHGENGALSLSSEFTATLPDLTPAGVRVEASVRAAFLQVAGQQVTEVAADVVYAEPALEFMATAREGARELDAGGSVVFHPDHQEIHLLTLGLRAEDIEWRAPADADATVRYAKDRITIENLRLASAGSQQITAGGVIGSMEEPLLVRLENVDVAALDRLLAGDTRVAGRLSADAELTGPTSAPAVEARFTLSDGTFQDFAFESLGGTVDYEGGEDVAFDVRLQQTPAEWLAAKGRTTMTLFRPAPEGTPAGAHVEPSPGDMVDIEVSSSEIGLGFVQGFTSTVTEIAGVLQADLRITGSGHDPHVSGAIDIRGGAFAVPDLGTEYTGLDTRIDFTPEGVAIREFRILDERGFPTTIGGTLGFHNRSLGDVDVRLRSDRFEVLNNELADITIDADIRVSGDIDAPRVEGTIDLESGTIHVAELLERVTANTYAEAAVFGPPEPGAPPSAETPAAGGPSLFDALALDVGLNVPNNLVLRGDDIRTANVSVSIGDMNVTVGGDLRIGKQPSAPVRVVGNVNTVRGNYTFQGRRFDIVRDGRIGFSGADEIDPRLDLQAGRLISGIETFVHVRGTMRRPELSFSSNPPLDEADVLSLIIFNQPVNQLGAGEQVSLAQRASALASGYVTSGLSRSIGNALDLDEFEIQAQGEQGGGGPAVTVGEQIGRNLFVRLRQGFGSEQTTELILEYQIAAFLRAQGSIAQGTAAAQRVQFRRIERGGLDLIFFFSY
jgi:hypothetical protein